MRGLRLEFFKARRKKLWLAPACMLVIELIWSMWAMGRMDAADLRQGGMYFLYQFPMLNTILIPITTAVLASRLCDMEHKGQTLKLMDTLCPPGRLFDAKFLCGAVYLGAACVLQVLAIFCAGAVAGFRGGFPAGAYAFYFISTLAVSLTLYLLQLVLSLNLVNQAPPLIAGVVGGFLGLFSMFFPRPVQRLVPWCYYAVLSPVGMNWDPATRWTEFYWMPRDCVSLAVAALAFGALYAAGRRLFARKEV